MKRIVSLLIVLLLPQTSLAYDWITSWQAREGREWAHQFKSTSIGLGGYMEEDVIPTCTAPGLMAPHAVKVTFPNGEEKVFVCNEVRAEHGLPPLPW